MALRVKKGETRILNKVFYMGKIFVNFIGQWKKGLNEPVWILTNLSAEQGLSFYLQRMKIDESFEPEKSAGNEQNDAQKTSLDGANGLPSTHGLYH